MEQPSARRRRRPPRPRPEGGAPAAAAADAPGPGDPPAVTAGGPAPIPGRPGTDAPPADRTLPGRAPAPPDRPHESAGRGRRDRQEDASDRFLRALVTHRGTQVPSVAAMRAREVALPSAQDIADAERDVVIRRRYYQPTDELPTGRNRGGRSGPRA